MLYNMPVAQLLGLSGTLDKKSVMGDLTDWFANEVIYFITNFPLRILTTGNCICSVHTGNIPVLNTGVKLYA